MTTVKLKYLIIFIIYAVVSALIVLVQSTGLITLQIDTASAVLALPLVIYAGLYFGEFAGALIGLILGALSDTYSSTLTYNTIALTVCGFLAGIMIAYIFNRNVASACVLNIVAAVVFFFIKWLVVYAFSDPVPSFVLFRFMLPTAIYTAVLGILMYFALNPLLKGIVRPRNN